MTRFASLCNDGAFGTLCPQVFPFFSGVSVFGCPPGRSTVWALGLTPVLSRNRVLVLIARSALEEIHTLGGGDPRQPKGLDEANGADISGVDFGKQAAVVMGLENMGDDASCQLAGIPLPPE